MNLMLVALPRRCVPLNTTRGMPVTNPVITLGKMVNDVAEAKMPDEDWNALIDEVVLGGMLTRD